MGFDTHITRLHTTGILLILTIHRPREYHTLLLLVVHTNNPPTDTILRTRWLSVYCSTYMAPLSVTLRDWLLWEGLVVIGRFCIDSLSECLLTLCYACVPVTAATGVVSPNRTFVPLLTLL